MRILDGYDRCPVTGKVIYPTREDARRVGDRRQAESGLRIKVYTCPNCKGLHLSSHFVNRERGSSALGVQIPAPMQQEVIPMASAPAPAPAAPAARGFPADRGITRAVLDVVAGYTEAKPIRAHTIHGKVVDLTGDRKIPAKTVQTTLARLAERGEIGSIGGGLGRERWYYGLKPAASPVRQPAPAAPSRPLEHRICGTCGRDLPAADFSPSFFANGGACKACVYQRDRDRNNRRRAERFDLLSQRIPGAVWERSQIAAALEIGPQGVNGLMANMMREGLVEFLGGGRWRPLAQPPAVDPAPPPAPVVEAAAPDQAAPATPAQLPQVAELQQHTMEAVALLWRCIERERAAWERERAALRVDRESAWAAERASLVAERDAALELAQQLEDRIAGLRAALG